ncbi:uncharacterized protein LOC133209759 [Neopsephotus bourkii]|uniref:uncharacterized protein LOC133209759 n=1 Tax=Neopsephotus bourkii TaxID=309878 RepID=UPI002AA56B32|nr:uncharacterized protein LOC133209759 [Neopsephotus bourkii]
MRNSQTQLRTTAAQLYGIPAHGSTVVRPRSSQPAPHRPTASATAKGTGNVSAVLRNNIETLQQARRSRLARAPEEEYHQAPLLPMAPAPASRGFSRQAAAAQAQHQSPALHCVTGHVADVQVLCSTVPNWQFGDVAKEEAKVPFFAECGEQAAPGQTERQAPAMNSSAENDTDPNVPSMCVKREVSSRAGVEEVEAPASPGISRQAAAGQAEGRAPAPHSHKENNVDLEVTPNSILKKVHYRDAAEEEAETPASYGFESQAPAAEAQCNAPDSDNIRVADAKVQATRIVSASYQFRDRIEEEAEETDSSDKGEQEAVAVDQETSRQLLEGQDMTQILDAAVTREEKDWEEGTDKVLSQEEDITVRNLWVNPSVAELFQDPQADIQEGSGFPSSMRMDLTGEAGENLQSISPIPPIPTDTKLAASTLGGAAEEEEHPTPLTLVPQEEQAAPAPVSPACVEQEAAQQAQRQVPALLSPDAYEMAVEEVARNITEQKTVEEEQKADEEELDRKEEEKWEEAMDKELSEVEEINVCNLWVNPSVPELFQDTHADPQERFSCPTSMGMDATGEAAGDSQSTSPVPAGPTDTKLAASTLPGAAEEEEHRAPLTSVSQEDAALGPASLGVDEHKAAPQAQSQALALLSPDAYERVVEEMSRNTTEQVLITCLAMIQGASQQVAEPQDMTQILDAAVDKEEKEWVEGTDKVLSQVEDFTVGNIWLNPLVPELFQDPQEEIQEGSGFPSSMRMDLTGEAAGDLQRVSPVPDVPTDTKLAASTLGGAAEEEEHQTPLTLVPQEEQAAPAPVSPACVEQEAAPQAQRQVPALLSPDAYEVAVEEVARNVAEPVPIMCLAMIQGASQQVVEPQEMTQILDAAVDKKEKEWVEGTDKVLSQVEEFTIRNIWVNPSVPELFQDTHADPQERFSCPTSMGMDATGEAAGDLQSTSPVPAGREAATSHVPPGADGNGGASASPLCRDSPRQGRVRRFVRKHLGKAVTVIHGKRQQRVEEPDVALSLDAESPSMSPAVFQDSEKQPGIATLPDPGAAPRRRLHRFRRVLRALRKAFCSSCLNPRVEE